MGFPGAFINHTSSHDWSHDYQGIDGALVVTYILAKSEDDHAIAAGCQSICHIDCPKPFNGEENFLGRGRNRVKNSTLDFSTETYLLVMLPVSTHNKHQQYRLLILYNRFNVQFISMRFPRAHGSCVAAHLPPLTTAYLTEVRYVLDGHFPCETTSCLVCWRLGLD